MKFMNNLTLTKPVRPAPVETKIDQTAAIAEANGFILDHLPDRFCAGVPQIVLFPVSKVWAVPILLSYPEIGPVGEVGVVAVDAELGTVVGWSPLDEVVQAAEKIYAARKNEIEVAFS